MKICNIQPWKELLEHVKSRFLYVTLEVLPGNQGKLQLIFKKDLYQMRVQFTEKFQIIIGDSRQDLQSRRHASLDFGTDILSQDLQQSENIAKITLQTKELAKALLCTSFHPNAIIFGLALEEALVIYVHWDPIITTYKIPHLLIDKV